MIKTVTLTGAEAKVGGLGGFNTVVHNLGGETLFASKYPGIAEGADNVAEIPAGAAKLISTTNGTVYLLGTGRAELTGQDHDGVNFRQPSLSNGNDGGDADTVNGHTVNADVPADAKFTDTTYTAATQSKMGLMTATDKRKLDGIEEGANNYSLPLATDSVRGGVKTGYTANGKNYPVKLSGEQMYVNVPWTDTNTTYGVMSGASASAAGKAGLVPAPAAGAQEKYLRGDGVWYNPISPIAQSSGLDLDDFKTSGFYFFSAANAPSNAPAGTNGWLLVLSQGSAVVKQVWYRMGTVNSTDFQTFVRTCINSIWGDWKRLAAADEIPSYTAATQSKTGLMTAADKTKLDGIEEGANNFTHPTTAGNKHIPSGGSANQILMYDGAGTAKWSSNCYAAAFALNSGNSLNTGVTLSYKADRTKALIIFFYTGTVGNDDLNHLFGRAVVSGLSDNMTAISWKSVLTGPDTTAMYAVSANGDIVLNGSANIGYIVIRFN